jgi:hypothetical protein
MAIGFLEKFSSGCANLKDLAHIARFSSFGWEWEGDKLAVGEGVRGEVLGGMGLAWARGLVVAEAGEGDVVSGAL